MRGSLPLLGRFAETAKLLQVCSSVTVLGLCATSSQKIGARMYGTRCLDRVRNTNLEGSALPASTTKFPLAGGNDFLLMSDLDGTLVGDDKALAELNNYWLDEHVAKRGSVLGYSTGRELPNYMNLVEQITGRGQNLMRPDVLVTCDGTQVWWFQPGDEEPHADENWAKKMSVGWDRQVVRDAFRRSLDLICKKEQPSGDMGVGAHGEVLDGREKPPEVEPFRFSTSLATEEMARACVAGVREDLDKVAGLDVHVFCNAGGPNRGWWVVGLPTAGGKGNALKYVMDAVGVVPSQTLCCGDSGNDSPMFDFHNVGVKGVVVANAFDDLRGYCEQQVCQHGQPIHFFASEKMAGGILEGLKAMHS